MFKYDDLDFYCKKGRTEATTFFSNGYAVAIVKQSSKDNNDVILHNINILIHNQYELSNLHNFKIENNLTNLTKSQVEKALMDISKLPPIIDFQITEIAVNLNVHEIGIILSAIQNLEMIDEIHIAKEYGSVPALYNKLNEIFRKMDTSQVNIENDLVPSF